MDKTSFNDSKGRKWSIGLNVGTVLDIREKLEIDFVLPEPATMLNMTTDPVALVNVLAIALADDLAAADETPEGFARAMDGDALDDAASAMMQAVVDFSRKAQRPALQEALACFRAGEKRVMDEAEKLLDSPEFQQKINGEIETAVEDIKTKLFGENPAT